MYPLGTGSPSTCPESHLRAKCAPGFFLFIAKQNMLLMPVKGVSWW